MSYTINYSGKLLNESFKNREFLVDNTSVRDRSLSIEFKAALSLEELDTQAKTFAMNYSKVGYINFFKTLEIEPSSVEQALYELYIYSYAKALHNGLYYKNISENADLGLAFRGHCSLFQILRNPSCFGLKDDYIYQFRIALGSDEYKQALLVLLLTRFPFLNAYSDFSSDALGTTSFIIPKYEGYLNRLNEGYYAIQHVQRGEQDVSSNAQTDTKEGMISKPTANRQRSSNQVIYSEGKITILPMNNNSSASILNYANTPLFNAFQGSNGKDFYYLPVGNGKKVEFNPSFFFAKANFITLNESHSDIEKVNLHYKYIELSQQQQHMVCSEVFTNTGIKCRIVAHSKADDKRIILPKIDDLENWISKLGNRYSQLISLFEKLEEYTSLEEMFNELLPEGTKLDSR